MLRLSRWLLLFQSQLASGKFSSRGGACESKAGWLLSNEPPVTLAEGCPWHVWIPGIVVLVLSIRLSRLEAVSQAVCISSSLVVAGSQSTRNVLVRNSVQRRLIPSFLK